MGMDYNRSKNDITSREEIDILKKRANHHTKKMRILTKTEKHTWWGGSQSEHGPTDLDHVVPAKHLRFKNFNGADVDVRGWPQEASDAAKDAWSVKHSDHALLFFEVRKV